METILIISYIVGFIGTWIIIKKFRSKWSDGQQWDSIIFTLICALFNPFTLFFLLIKRIDDTKWNLKKGPKWLILILALWMTGCVSHQSSNTETRVFSENEGQIVTRQGIFSTVNDLSEFNYKGHLYISCKVRDGISLTHAGHCKCNK